MPEAQSSAPSAPARKTPLRRRRLLRLRQEIPRGLYLLAGWAVPLVLVVIWWLVTATGLVAKLFLPSPFAVLAEGWRQVTEGILVHDAAISIYQIGRAHV